MGPSMRWTPEARSKTLRMPLSVPAWTVSWPQDPTYQALPAIAGLCLVSTNVCHKCRYLWKYFSKKYLHISFQNEHQKIFCFWSTLICKNVFLSSVLKIFILTETLMELLFCSWMIETLFKRKWYIVTHISFPGARFGWIWILGVRIQSCLSGTTLHLETFLLSS